MLPEKDTLPKSCWVANQIVNYKKLNLTLGFGDIACRVKGRSLLFNTSWFFKNKGHHDKRTEKHGKKLKISMVETLTDYLDEVCLFLWLLWKLHRYHFLSPHAFRKCEKWLIYCSTFGPLLSLSNYTDKKVMRGQGNAASRATIVHIASMCHVMVSVSGKMWGALSTVIVNLKKEMISLLGWKHRKRLNPEKE